MNNHPTKDGLNGRYPYAAVVRWYKCGHKVTVERFRANARRLTVTAWDGRRCPVCSRRAE